MQPLRCIVSRRRQVMLLNSAEVMLSCAHQHPRGARHHSWSAMVCRHLRLAHFPMCTLASKVRLAHFLQSVVHEGTATV